MDPSRENQPDNDFSFVVTAPSSPDVQHPSPSLANPRGGVEDCSASPYSSDSTYILPSITQPDTLMPTQHARTSPTPPSVFEQTLANSHLPDPGPDYFLARRKLWLTPRPQPSSEPSATPKQTSTQLQSLLEGPVEDLYKESNWKGGVGKICERILVNREALSQKLPLRHLVCAHAYPCRLTY